MTQHIARISTDIGNPRIVFQVDTRVIIEQDYIWFKEYLETTIQQGTIYKDGELMQVGVVGLKLVANKAGDLELHEPDMQSIPVVFVNSCTKTLAFYRLQRMVNESVGFMHSQLLPWMGQTLVVCTRNSDDFLLHRVEPTDTDSGWFVGCLDADHDHQHIENLLGISVFDAIVQKPEIIEFLALPPGITITLRAGKPAITYGGQILPFQTGSYLDRKHSR